MDLLRAARPETSAMILTDGPGLMLTGNQRRPQVLPLKRQTQSSQPPQPPPDSEATNWAEDPELGVYLCSPLHPPLPGSSCCSDPGSGLAPVPYPLCSLFPSCDFTLQQSSGSPCSGVLCARIHDGHTRPEPASYLQG